MKLRYTRRGAASLDSILTYVSERNPPAAKKVHLRIQAFINLLLLHPHVGVATARANIFRIATPPYPYVIYYRPSDTEIIIHAVRHTARKQED